MGERIQANCVGAAYAQIGYAPDGSYHPEEVLDLFHIVPKEEAELVAAVTKRGLVEHVIAYNPANPDTVTHRANQGLSIQPDVSFEKGIGFGERVGYTLLYMRRNEDKRP